MTEEEFSARAALIGSVTYDEIKKATDSLTYTDTLELAGKPAGLVYAVRYVNAAGERAAFSNFLRIEPAGKVAEPPRITRAEQLSENTIALTWEPPKANIDGSTPVNILGYNVYRVTASPTDGQTPINQALISGTQYEDKNFKLGEKYQYVVRAVSLGTEGGQVESLNSNSVELTPVDTYPPSAPGGLSIAPGAPGRLLLFWAPNPEPDVAGYYIYRSTDPNLPKDKWTRLTPALHTRTTFTDENVEVGKTYYYYVVAVDTAGNVSPSSEVDSETAP